MKFNKWTVGLAAVGAISLTSAARADDAPKMSQLNIAESGTTISGYIDVAAQYNAGNVGEMGYTDIPAGTSSDKVDSFSLNTFDIAIDKPQDDSPWAAGYHGELEFGQDLVYSGYPSSSSSSSSGYGYAVRQAYVVVRTPVGNGIDWKVGVMDDIIGYESNTDGANPNYTRSIGYFYEPTTLVGMIGSYKVNDMITVQAGLAENWTGYSGNSEVSSKTFAGAIALTAPDSWGWAKGATLNLGALVNPYKYGTDNYYVGLTVPTPISALKMGYAFDLYSDADSGYGNPHNNSGWVLGMYGCYQATDKLSLNLRGEYYDFADGEGPYFAANYPYNQRGNGLGEEITATVQYNLWANVISRVEFRWDHVDSGNAFGVGGNSSSESFSGYTDPNSNSFLLAVNLIYTF